MTAKIITSMAELVAAIRARRDELNIPHEVIDDLAGVQPGYTSKILAPVPSKNLGFVSMPAILGALGIGLVVVEDAARCAVVKSRWRVRKRPPNPKRIDGALLITGDNRSVSATNGDNDAGTDDTTGQAADQFSGETGTGGPDQEGSI